MSPKAIANSGELERFARELAEFTRELDKRIERLNHLFAKLGDIWLDQEHRRFASEFERTMRLLKQFNQSAEKQILFLHRKGQRLQEYLDLTSESSSTTSSAEAGRSHRGKRGSAAKHSALNGSQFEVWAAEHVFHGKQRITVLPELNRHLEREDPEGMGLLKKRSSDNYVDEDGSLWDAKAYSEKSVVDLDQLRDYALMVDAGMVIDATGKEIAVNDIRYLFKTRKAAEKNYDDLADRASVWYIDWRTDGTGELKQLRPPASPQDSSTRVARIDR